MRIMSDDFKRVICLSSKTENNVSCSTNVTIYSCVIDDFVNIN